MTYSSRQPLETYELVSTKLEIPQRCFPIVSRRALLDRLDGGLNFKLILLSAPAGSGKTTLVGEWLDTRREGLSPFAWVSLDGRDNDLVRFWSSVFMACRAFNSAIGEKGLTQLHTWQNPHIETILSGWINELAGIPREGILCLDDYHEIILPQIQDSIHFMIDHLPRQLHLVILTRDVSGLPLAHLRAHHEVCELRSSDLRFSPAETSAFLQQNVPYELSTEAISQLDNRLEGWAAGLRLVALALQNRSDLTDRQEFINSLSGDDRVFQDYLFSDVLHSQPAAVQEFLLKTSILDCLSGPLCDAVTGRDDSLDLLARVENANLFLTPLRGDGNWFRYHHLFAEALRQRARRQYGDAMMREGYLKASQWNETQGLLVEAVETSFQAGDYERAADLLDRMIAPRLVQNEHRTLRRLIGRLPEEVLATRPKLCFCLAMAIFFTSDQRSMDTIDQIESPLGMAEGAWRAYEDLPKLGEALAFRAILHWRSGDFPRSFGAARRALELLPAEEKQWRSVSLIVRGTEALFNGKLSAAWRMLMQAQRLSQAAGNPHGVLETTHLLGNVSLERGDLVEARWFFNQTLEKAEQFAHMPLFERGYAWLGLSSVSFEWNDLAAAKQQAGRALEIGRQTGEGYTQARAALILSRISFIQDDLAGAKERLQATIGGAPQAGSPLLAREILAYGVWFCLATGDLAGANRWIDDWEGQSPFFSSQKGAAILGRARLRLAQGQPDQAVDLLAGYPEQVRDRQRVKNEIEFYLLNALAWSALDQKQAGQQAIMRALGLAQPGGFLRVFLDEGEPVFRLLKECRGAVEAQVKERSLSFYETLMGAFSRQRPGGLSVDRSDQAAMSGAVIDPLSAQEERVFAMLVRGFSYQEIASELIVSINTVKTHVKGVYRKLNVTRRRDARELARRLRLV